MFVVDASIVIKWVVEEQGTTEALALRDKVRLIAPDLLVSECANILWKKVRRGELSGDEAFLAARILEGADVELLPARSLLEAATRIAIAIDHPAYDCMYLALAKANDIRFVTADERIVRKVSQSPDRAMRRRVIGLHEAIQSS